MYVYVCTYRCFFAARPSRSIPLSDSVPVSSVCLSGLSHLQTRGLSSSDALQTRRRPVRSSSSATLAVTRAKRRGFQQLIMSELMAARCCAGLAWCGLCYMLYHIAYARLLRLHATLVLSVLTLYRASSLLGGYLYGTFYHFQYA